MEQIVKKYRNNDCFNKFDVFNNVRLLIVGKISHIEIEPVTEVLVEGLLEKYIPNEPNRIVHLHDNDVIYIFNDKS